MAMTPAQISAAMEDVLEARLTGRAVVSYSVDGRSFQYTPLAELSDLVAYWKRRAAAEATGSGLPVGYCITARTNPPPS